MKIVLVTGSRSWGDSSRIYEALLREEPDLIIEGGAPGADRFAELWAKTHDVPCLRWPARWDKYGPSAGHIRNSAMVDFAKALSTLLESTHAVVVVLAFPLGTLSPGTRGCMAKARKAGLVVVDEGMP